MKYFNFLIWFSLFIVSASIHEIAGSVVIIACAIIKMSSLRLISDMTTQKHLVYVDKIKTFKEISMPAPASPIADNKLQSYQDNTFEYENIDLKLTQIPNALDIQGMDGDILGVDTL